MSWIVQSIIRNQFNIRSVQDLESDEYNNLLIIEKAINDLTKTGSMTNQELQIVNLISMGYTFRDMENILDVSRETISKIFIATCDRISYYLGGEFTDEGMLEYMQEKYDLEDNQIDKLRNFMKSKLKHKIIRKDINVN